MGACNDQPAAAVQRGVDRPETAPDKGIVEVIDQVVQARVGQGVVAVNDNRAFDHVFPLARHRIRVRQVGTQAGRIVVGIKGGHDHVEGDIVRQDPGGAERIFRNQLEQGRIAEGHFRCSRSHVQEAQEVCIHRSGGDLDVHGVARKEQGAGDVAHQDVESCCAQGCVDIGNQVIDPKVVERGCAADRDRGAHSVVVTVRGIDLQDHVLCKHACCGNGVCRPHLVLLRRS